MGADANMADHAAFFQIHYIVQKFGVLQLLPLLLRIHIMDHPQVDIICLQAF